MTRDRHPLESGSSRDGVRDELEHYLEERAREFEAQGLTPDEARLAAEAAFGDVSRIENQVREVDASPDRGGGGWRMGAWIGDLRYAWRSAWRRPGATALVALTLGLGIGATTAIFTVVNASLLRALPFAGADELVFLRGAYDAPEGPQVRGASYPEAEDWAERSSSFDGLASFSGRSVTLTGVDRAERLQAEAVTGGYFDLLRVQPVLGRTLGGDDHARDGSGLVAVISEDLWTRAFGGDASVLGRVLSLDDQSFTIVGVAPRTFQGLTLGAEVWLPLEASGAPIEVRGTRWLSVVARLRTGVELEQASDDMTGVAAQLEQEYPAEHEDRIALVSPLREVYLGDTRTLMWVVLGATALLLLIAAANVTNLLLVRAGDRRGEMLVRTALGAGRGRIRMQLLTESLALAALSAVLGLGLGVWGARALAEAMPDGLMPAYVNPSLDLGVFAFTLGTMTLVGVLAGLAPALHASRHDVAAGLRQGGTGRHPRGSLQSLLVVGEVALAFLILVGAGLMTRSFLAQLRVEPGFDAAQLYAFSLDFPGERYAQQAREAAARDLLDRLGAHPDVVSASLANDAPLVTGTMAAYIWTEGSTAEDRIRFYRHHVMPGYFETLGIEILQGRALTWADETPVAVVSRAMAERHFQGEGAVGRSLRVGGPDGEAIRIVGVADDVRYRDLTTDLVAGPTDPDVFLPWNQWSTGSVAVVVRTAGDPAALERVVLEIVRELDPDLAVYNAGPLARGLAAATAQGRFGTLLLTVFAGLAVLLCGLGLYGVLSSSVARRTRELAVRVAIGAPMARLQWMVMRQTLVLLAGGLALGVAGSLGATRTLEAFLFGVGASDPATYVMVGLLLTLVALVAAYLPAARATRVDPQRALKAD